MIELIVYHPPDGETEVRVFNDGTEVPLREVGLYVIDAGYGYTRQEWDETTEAQCEQASAVCAPILRVWRDSEAEDSPYIEP